MSVSTEVPAIYESSPELIATFIEGLGAKVKSFEGVERRLNTRFVVAMPSSVQPLNENLARDGEPFTAAIRDISAVGIGLIHTKPIKAKYLDVCLSPPNGHSMRLLVRVLRCRPLGAYFDIGGEFVLPQAEDFYAAQSD